MAEENGLFGIADGKMDPNTGRISIPNEMRSLATQTVRITVDPRGRFLEVRLIPAFADLARRIREVAATLAPDEAEALLTDYLGFSAEGQVDGSLRLVVPKKIREFLGGENEVVLAGAGDCLQVWPASKYAATRDDRRTALARAHGQAAHAILGLNRTAPAAAPTPTPETAG